jgi:hypothetical protein
MWQIFDATTSCPRESRREQLAAFWTIGGQGGAVQEQRDRLLAREADRR